jgi:hypothetical protein
VHRLDAFTDHQRRAQQHMRALIWWFYRDLKPIVESLPATKG